MRGAISYPTHLRQMWGAEHRRKRNALAGSDPRHVAAARGHRLAGFLPQDAPGQVRLGQLVVIVAPVTLGLFAFANAVQMFWSHCA